MSADEAMPTFRVNVEALPDGMRERFVMLLALGLLGSHWYGQTWAQYLSTGHESLAVAMLTHGFASVSIFLFLTASMYLVHPLRIRRAFGATLPIDTDPLIAGRVRALAASAGFGSIAVELSRDVRRQDAVAFGLPFRRRIIIGGGLRVVARLAPSDFDAIISHELAHLRHADVDFGHLSVAIARAFEVVSVVTVVIWAIAAFRAGTTQIELLYGIAPLALWVVLLRLEYASLLRSREFYADAAAAVVTPASSLAALFTRLSNKRDDKSLLSRLLAFHPTPAERARSIQSPDILLKAPALYFVALGYIGGLIMTTASNDFGRTVAKNSDISTFLKLIGFLNDHPVEYFTMVFFQAIILLWAATVASSDIRRSFSVIIRGGGFAENFLGSARLAVLVGVGGIVGVLLNPSSVQNFLTSGVWSPVSGARWWDWGLLWPMFSAATCVASTIMFVVAKRIANARRPGAPSRWWRLLCIALWLWVYLDVKTIIGMLISMVVDGVVSLQTFMIAYALVDLSVGLVIGVVSTRGRRWRELPVPSAFTGPAWLYKASA